MSEASDLAGMIRRHLWAVKDYYEASLEPPRLKMSEANTGTKDAPLPLSAHIIDTRGACHADLMHYTRVIQFEVHDINGGTIQTRVDGDDDEQMATFIDTWAERLAAIVPAEARQCEIDMAGHACALRALALGLGARRFRVGACPEHGTSELGERVPCVGDLRAVLRKDDDMLPSEIHCTVDESHAWTTGQWMMLGRRVLGEMTA